MIFIVVLIGAGSFLHWNTAEPHELASNKEQPANSDQPKPAIGSPPPFVWKKDFSDGISGIADGGKTYQKVCQNGNYSLTKEITPPAGKVESIIWILPSGQPYRAEYPAVAQYEYLANGNSIRHTGPGIDGNAFVWPFAENNQNGVQIRSGGNRYIFAKDMSQAETEKCYPHKNSDIGYAYRHQGKWFNPDGTDFGGKLWNKDDCASYLQKIAADAKTATLKDGSEWKIISFTRDGGIIANEWLYIPAKYIATINSGLAKYSWHPTNYLDDWTVNKDFQNCGELFIDAPWFTADSNLRTSSAITGKVPEHGCIEIDSGETIPPDLAAHNSLLWEYGTPREDEEYRKYIQPSNSLVVWTAAMLELKDDGLFFKNTGKRLLIVSNNDSKNYPKYSDYWQYPGYTLYFTQGDCDDRAIAVCSILRNKGYSAICVVGKYDNDGHMWVEAKLNGIIYIYDSNQCFPKESNNENYTAVYIFNDLLGPTQDITNW